MRNKAFDHRDEITYLLPEFNLYDNLLLVDDATGTYSLEKIRDSLRTLSLIEHQLLLNASDLKNKENLSFYYS